MERRPLHDIPHPFRSDTRRRVFGVSTRAVLEYEGLHRDCWQIQTDVYADTKSHSIREYVPMTIANSALEHVLRRMNEEMLKAMKTEEMVPKCDCRGQVLPKEKGL